MPVNMIKSIKIAGISHKDFGGLVVTVKNLLGIDEVSECTQFTWSENLTSRECSNLIRNLGPSLGIAFFKWDIFD